MIRMAIVGPGALGCFLAGRLSKYAEVWLLDKDAGRSERIMANGGIFCEGISGKWQAKIPITAQVGNIGEVDLIIFCVKAYDTKNAMVACQPLIKPKTIVLSLQNGLGNIEIIAEVVGPENVLAGSTSIAVTALGEGKIQHEGEGVTVIGNMEGTIPVIVREIREIFNKAKMETKVTRDIKNILWSKLVLNAGINALSAVTRLRNGQLIQYESTAELLRLAVTEAVKVARRKRVKLTYDDALAKVEAVCEASRNNISSMLQDVLRQKKTEVDYINGVIVRQGRSAGIPTPVNAVLWNCVKAIESSYETSVK